MARTRYRDGLDRIKLRDLPAAALRAVLREGYTRADLRADVLAGLVVGIVALPLAMALAIAVGVAPQYGLYTSIVAGVIVAALGGSRLQVTGPTAAFIVILAPIYAKFGMGGLLLSGVMGGLILIAMGIGRLGQLIEFIPHPVTTGFTAGIATVIATLQVKDILGLRLTRTPETRQNRRHVASARFGVHRRACNRSRHTRDAHRRPTIHQAGPVAAHRDPPHWSPRGRSQSILAQPRRDHDREPLSHHRWRARL